MIRWLIVIAMLMHGVGHIMFFFEAFGLSPMGIGNQTCLLPMAFTVHIPVVKSFRLLCL